MSDEKANVDRYATQFRASADTVAHVSDNLEQDDSKTTGSGDLTVRCPNCHAPTEVAPDTTLTDLTCSACGSHFSLVDQTKATRMAPPLTKLGRFDLIERLGVGGFGSVWKARDKDLDRTVAIKIPRQNAMSVQEQEQFFREARAAAQLRHPHIVSVHEVGRDGDSIYIVSDFVRGVTLGDWLTGQQLTSREAAELCGMIADALHHAHEQGVVHRDLKPANIIIDGDGQPHLMDFGLARRDAGEVSVTMDGQVLGTPAYMSPEQAEGKAHTADRRSDVYSLGVILFQLLTGELPFRGNARMLIHQVINDEPPSPRKLNANISKDLETITLKCLEKDANRRYQTSQVLERELRRFLSGEPILSRPVGGFERSWRWARRNSRVAVLAASVAILLVAVASLSLVGFAVARKQQLAAQQAAAREASLRGLAEDNLGLAEKAVDDYLTRVAEDERLKQDDFHKLRTELLETAVPFYERFAAQKPGDAESKANQANAYARLASIHGETGQQKQTVREYEQAITIEKDLVANDPGNGKFQQELANECADLGWTFHVVGDYAGAQPHYEEAITILVELLKSEPNNANYRRTLAATRERFGLLLSHSAPSAAKEQYEQAIKIGNSLVDEFPNSADYQSLVASSMFRLGFVIRKQDPTSAREHLIKAAELQRKLVASHPKDSEYRYALAESVGYLGDALNSLGDHQGARRQYEEGIEIQEKVLAEHPSVLKYRKSLGDLRWTYADLLSSSSGRDSDVDFKQIAEQCEAAAPIYEQLAADFPDEKTHLSRAAYLHMMASHFKLRLGDAAGALKGYEHALDLADDLPSNYRDQYNLPAKYQSHTALGYLLFLKGDWIAADQHFALATAVQENSNDQLQEADRLNKLAWFLATSPIDAVRDGKRAVALARKACELTQYKIATVTDTLSAAYAEDGDFDAARKWSESSLELCSDSSAYQRDEFLKALADYKAKRPRRDLTLTEIVVRIQSKSLSADVSEPANNKFINIEHGGVALTPILPGWLSARWILTPANDSNGLKTFRFQNQWKPEQCLNVVDGKVQTGPASMDSSNDFWELDPSTGGNVRIKCHTIPTAYLRVQNSKLELGPIEPDSESADWKIQAVLD
ncbi:MAG TPA: protein kinase [Lacipirellulaceae bacterium]|nr:protein kinase [Lacipirellulaceae bacterium]